MQKIVCVFCALLLSFSLFAEAFGNNMMQIPSVSYLRAKNFGVGDQFMIGLQYAGAITYGFWWFAETNVGFGKPLAEEEKNTKTIASAHGLIGMRYNFGHWDFRPFVGGALHYLQFISRARTTPWAEHDYTPIWVGLKPFAGIEWQFMREMGFQLEGAYDIYVNFRDPFKQSISVKLSYNFYF